MRKVSNWAYRLSLLFALIGVALAIALSVSIGSVAIPLDKVAQVFAHAITPQLYAAPDSLQSQIVLEFRLPRALLAAVVGAGLAVSGAVLQSIVRNPLADPYVFGVSSGASVGAVAVITVFAITTRSVVTLGALLGAVSAMFVVFLLAQARGSTNALRLVLAGVAVSFTLSAATSFMILRVSEPGSSVAAVLAWLSGSLGGASWESLGFAAPAVIVLAILLLFGSRALNAFQAGDDLASSMGVNPSRYRLYFFLVTSGLVAVVVSVSGAIGFVGLLVPHVVRSWVGSDSRKVLPFSAVLGALLLVLVDIVARVVLAPTEVPVGVITALIGGPAFLILLRRIGSQA
ncbi:MAG: iron ABC transporter permease [Actinobacteria bacterium]|nr:iron ABC transporter permease [Actinomycetota bacterium]